MGQIKNYNIEDLNKICESKVDIINANSQQNALLVFAYNSDNIHKEYQLLVWRDSKSRGIYYRIFIDNKLENIMRSVSELRLVVGNHIEAEIDEVNIIDNLKNDEKNGIISNEQAEALHLHDEEKRISEERGDITPPLQETQIPPMPSSVPNIPPMDNLMNGLGGGMGMLGALFGGMMGGMPPMTPPPVNNEENKTDDIIDAEVKPVTEEENKDEIKEE